MSKRRLMLLLFAIGVVTIGILLQVASGPTIPTPTTQMGFVCLTNPAGQNTGIRFTVPSAAPMHWWRFECPDFASAIQAVARLDQQWCIAGAANAAAVSLGENTIDGYQDTTNNLRTVRFRGFYPDRTLRARDGNYAFPCGALVPTPLVPTMQQGYSTCCL
jgi:hypothetical protein